MSAQSNAVVNISLSNGAFVQNRYRIVQQLGRGGMGAVYEAVDERLGITVALKETLSTEVSIREQFEKEARLLACLQHPALPRVTDHFVDGDRAYLVMQFIAGVDLASIIAQQPGPFPTDQVIAWADQLLDALIYLHSHDRQIIHRDIKPHNLKLTSSGKIALLDFGLAKASPTDTSVTASRAFFGYTRQYAPLEQIEDRRTDPRSDIYALGATLYHLLTGIKPPDALVRAAASINSEVDPLVPANKIYAAVGPQVSAILEKAMALRPEHRYASAAEFREALRRTGRSRARNETEIQPSPMDRTAMRYREAIGPRLAMVESQKRFGPGKVAALFLILMLGVALATIYNVRPSSTREENGARVTEEDARPAAALRKTERVTANGNVTVRKREAEKKDQIPTALIQNKKDRNRSSRTATNQESADIKPAKTRQPVNAPALRLPSPMFDDGLSGPVSEVRPAAYKSPAPQFYRSADGTLTVRFSDGSTRVVRPGSRTAQ